MVSGGGRADSRMAHPGRPQQRTTGVIRLAQRSWDGPSEAMSDTQTPPAEGEESSRQAEDPVRVAFGTDGPRLGATQDGRVGTATGGAPEGERGSALVDLERFEAELEGGRLRVRRPEDDKPPRPKQLSPSRAADWEQCPQLYYFRAVARYPEPATEATARGRVVHEALDRLFGLPRHQRDEDHLKSLIADVWQEERESYPELLEDEAFSEDAFIDSLDRVAETYFKLERPWRFDPDERELKVAGEIRGVPIFGFVDRVDLDPGDGNSYITDYKALPLDTPVPTPGGFVKLCDLQVGDQVVGADGELRTVIGKSEIFPHRPLRRFRFDDGAEIVSDTEHNWWVSVGGGPAQILTTAEIQRLVNLGQRVSIRRASPAKFHPADVAESPYQVGLDLEARPELLEVARKLLWGSVSQRQALLAGLMDRGGEWEGNGGRYITGRADTADLVKALVLTLGGSVYSSGLESCGESGQTAYVVAFEGAVVGKVPQTGWRQIVAVEECGEGDTQCVAVDGDSLFCVAEEFIVTHNTGKLPKFPYREKAFFQLKFYAAALRADGTDINRLRLVYLSPEQRGVLTLPITGHTIDKAEEEIARIWAEINEAYDNDRWPTRPGPLCGWCYFQPICPAFGGDGIYEGSEIDIREVSERGGEEEAA